jgi:hypothetical protein
MSTYRRRRRRNPSSILKSPFWDTTGGFLVIAGVVLAGGYIVVKAIEGWGTQAVNTAGGLVSGNNVITQNTTDFSGTPETAYEGKGIPGTLGAAANTASGGILASIGNSIGAGLFDLFHGSGAPPAPAPTPAPSGGTGNTSNTGF